MLERKKTYKEVYDSFRWEIPEFYNIGVDVCDKWAEDKHRLCLIYEDEAGNIEKFSFWEIKNLSNQLANALRELGVARGERIAILLGQVPETVVSHVAAYKLGAIALPLFTLFGPEALEYRLKDSAAKILVTDSDNVEKVLSIRDNLGELRHIIVTDGGGDKETLSYKALLGKASRKFTAEKTKAEDPALLIYTSGTTGPPKGALHAHRVLLGHLPGVEFPHNFFPQKGDLFWTPADWAWAGGLLDVLLPSLHHGIPVVAFRVRKFDPERAFYLVEKHGIRNSFMPPTALKMMREVSKPLKRFPEFNIRSIGSGGETLGEEVLRWGREELKITINEFYGMTEVNLVVGNCYEVMEIKPDSMGKAIPGHIVDIVDEKGRILSPGETGEVAVKGPDPVMLLEYWGKPEATKEKFVGDWWLTGDLARKDEDGYFYFLGRKDDLISSAGYRIGPSEIEACLIKHPAVAMAAAIGSPDELRGEIVKAFIQLKVGYQATKDLSTEIQEFVKKRLSAHEYPREIEFVKELPLTATGKIRRADLRKLEIERKRSKT